jgi:tetratricopeptide (TPR) repeat protein
MEPHGLILKLNNEKLEKLDPDIIERDREFWNKLSKELLADSRFVANEGARKTYSKMRSAIGGLYAYRSLRDEAEAAFKQAITLCPASPEANFRLAQLYMEMGRADDAIALLEKLQKLDPNNDKIAMAIEQLRKMKHETEQPK